MRYFVVSDIHGHFKEFTSALNESGYDENNKKHFLIIDGDMFDRGSESAAVFSYLYPLEQTGRAAVLKGNHELFFRDLFQDHFNRVHFNMLHNGFDKTLESFVPDFSNLSLSSVKEQLRQNVPLLEGWLDSLPFFYETEHYVITHAGLDFSNGDFKNGNWEQSVWIEPEQFFESDLEKAYHFHKKVIVGHRFTFIMREYFHPEQGFDSSVYIHDDKQKIAIDGGSYYTHRINVFIFEDNPL